MAGGNERVWMVRADGARVGVGDVHPNDHMGAGVSVNGQMVILGFSRANRQWEAIVQPTVLSSQERRRRLASGNLAVPIVIDEAANQVKVPLDDGSVVVFSGYLR